MKAKFRLGMTREEEHIEQDRLREEAFSRGVYATHVLFYEGDSDRIEGLSFFARVEGEEGLFYMMQGFERSYSLGEIESNTLQSGGRLIRLGDNGISIAKDGCLCIRNGEFQVYEEDAMVFTPVETILAAQ